MQRNDGGAIVALLAGIFGLVLGLVLGLPGLVLGPLAYFIGKSSVSRIDESKGTVGGRGSASAGSMMGIVATAIGAVVTLVWFTVWLVAVMGPPPT